MERLPIDANLPERLKVLTGPVELIDDRGYVVAVVQPRLDPALYELVGPDISEEELDRRCQPGRKRYTTDEVLAMLRKLP